MSEIGVIGLGTMGSNLARNIASRDIKVSVYNRTTEKMTKLIEEHGSEFMEGHEKIEDFINSLEKPRRIMLLVKAGQVVDKIIDNIKPHLDKGDIIIDCGNSLYKDTERRFKNLKEDGLNFFGCGVSGGEEGALNGPSLMPGGHKPSWEKLKPILEAIAARDFSGGPCVTYCGEGPAGHYVKMVHNGIEYGVMQIIAEGYDILKSIYDLKPPELSKIFNTYNQGKLSSYLFEITAEVLSQKDEFQEGYLIDYILDKAGQKGTGRWTAIDALERGIPTPTIVEAVNARVISSFKERRTNLSKLYPSEVQKEDTLSLDEFKKILENAFYLSTLCSYAQGYEMIKTASDEEDWGTNLAEVSRIWEGGCIIRADILNLLHKSYQKSQDVDHLFGIKDIADTITEEVINDLRTVVALAAEHGVANPCLSVSLAYFESITQERTSANMIQGLRDYFGAHTYERTDKEGSFHTEW